MTLFQAIPATAASTADQGAVLVGVAVVTIVVLAVVGTAVWGSLRLRSAGPVLKKGVSSIREEQFASEVLREFLPAVKHDPVGAQGDVPEPAPGPAATSTSGPALAGEVARGGVRELHDFYANPRTAKPVKSAGPATVTLTTGTLTSGGSRPELSEVFDESVRELVEGIRGLATAVEQAALVGGGSELDRAARSVEAFTSGLGGLPVKDVLVSAGKAVEAGRTGRDEPLERST